jgi:hypothetical protein
MKLGLSGNAKLDKSTLCEKKVFIVEIIIFLLVLHFEYYLVLAS